MGRTATTAWIPLRCYYENTTAHTERVAIQVMLGGERRMETMPTSRTALPLFDELRGQRISVRPYRQADAQALMAAVAESREHVRPWLPFADAHQTVEESRDWIIQGMAAWLVRDELRLSLWELGTDRFLGGIGLPPRN